MGKGLDRVTPQTQQGPTLPRWPLVFASWEDGVKCVHQGLQSKHIVVMWVWVPAQLGVGIVHQGEWWCDSIVCLQEPRQRREALVLCGEGQRIVMGVLPLGSLWCGHPEGLGAE